ncbi:Actin-like protein 6B-like [Homarus americanus]|uniref:Actin-like protein 6B-like n=1 Tax=Homarus americanus TaxID=6706 RepID=A0A8J5MRE7_HOMAM|nr:Actin-like protein 6B-like [Homarus americanus]
MSGGVYGGDEVGALVFDPGHSSLRVGYAGEDSPKFDIPSWSLAEMFPYCAAVGHNSYTKSAHIYLGKMIQLSETYLSCEVVNYMKDGMIEDWDTFEKVLDYSYEKCIKSESQYHPILFSEATWNARGKRERLCELVFEKYQHAIVKSPLGGDFLLNQANNYLKESQVDIVPSYLIADKQLVKEGDRPKWTRKNNVAEVTSSWHNYMKREVVRDFQQTMLHCSEAPYDEETITSIPTEPFEFPTGYNNEYGIERYRITESLFDPSYIKGVGSTMLGMSHVVSTSIGLCDIDLRPSLYSGVIVTGGNSLLNGYVERLNRDLSSRTPPNMRFKLISATGTTERRFGSWIGGSILASLGSFQQMWISKQEYEESGKSQVDRKCP